MSIRRLKVNYEEGIWGVLGILVKKVFKGDTSSDSTYPGWNRMVGTFRGISYFEVGMDPDPDFIRVELEYTDINGLPKRYIVLKAHPLSILRSDIKTMIREYI